MLMNFASSFLFLGGFCSQYSRVFLITSHNLVSISVRTLEDICQSFSRAGKSIWPSPIIESALFTFEMKLSKDLIVSSYSSSLYQVSCLWFSKSTKTYWYFSSYSWLRVWSSWIVLVKELIWCCFKSFSLLKSLITVSKCQLEISSLVHKSFWYFDPKSLSIKAFSLLKVLSCKISFSFWTFFTQRISSLDCIY